MGLDETNFFDTDYRILEKTIIEDGIGSNIGTWTPKENSNYKGHHRTLKKMERTIDDRESFSSSHKHWCPANVNVNENQRIEVLSGEDAGKIFDIIPFKEVWGHHKTAELSFVK